MRDPVVRCVVTEDCVDSLSCPSGTRCLPRPPPESDADGQAADGMGSGLAAARQGLPFEDCGDGKPTGRECRVPIGAADARSALTTGFDVEEFALVNDSDSGVASFAWNAPGGTSIVHCALFSCVPEFRDVDNVARIINYDHCVLAEQTFSRVSAQFDLGNPVHSTPQVEGLKVQSADRRYCRVAGGSEPPESRAKPMVMDLSVGCWAYSETSLIGATRLISVRPGQSYPYHGAFTAECRTGSADNSGTSCLGAAAWGTCHQGACVHRCVVDDDCVLAAAYDAEVLRGAAAPGAAGAPNTGGVAPSGGLPEEPPRTCRRLHSAYVGVCVAEDAQ